MLSEHTRSIIGLAWARMLGLEDSALLGQPAGRRIDVVDDEAATVTFVQLFGHSIAYGPADVLAAAHRLQDEELELETVLLEIVRRAYPGARSMGEAHLLYAEEPPELAPADYASVSFESEHLDQLRTECPADDVAASGLVAPDWAVSLVAEGHDDGRAVAAAGREEWSHVLAQIGVMTRPDRRGMGLGRYIAAVAAEEAFADGLIPQWRAAAESAGSLRLGLSLGFEQAGSQTTVALD